MFSRRAWASWSLLVIRDLHELVLEGPPRLPALRTPQRRCGRSRPRNARKRANIGGLTDPPGPTATGKDTMAPLLVTFRALGETDPGPAFGRPLGPLSTEAPAGTQRLRR